MPRHECPGGGGDILQGGQPCLRHRYTDSLVPVMHPPLHGPHYLASYFSSNTPYIYELNSARTNFIEVYKTPILAAKSSPPGPLFARTNFRE